jgi:hemerythrin-like domain-containing protein
MSEQPHNVIDILTKDHREVEQMFQELESLRGATGEAERGRRKDLAEQVTIELIRHSVAEEAEVYPVVAKKVSESEAERSKHEHAEAEETMKRLEGLPPDDAAFDSELATLMREVREHVKEEEGEVFPQMRKVFSDDELVELGMKVASVKQMAPTRPHPAAPDGPPGDKILGPVAGLLDRMRDAVTHRGTGG